MARFRRKAARRSRGFFKSAKRSRSGGSSNGLWTIAGAMAYGAVREKASNMLAPITAKVQLGSIADEVVLGGLSWLAYKKISNPMVRNVALGGLIVESARVGEAIAKGQLSMNSSQTGDSYTYG